MTGLLLPLVLAAALSVVAVAAARSRRVPVSSPAAHVAPPPRQIAGVRISGRRLAGAGIVAAAVVGLVALAGQGPPHPGGDPGGRILADLRPAAGAVPAGSEVLSRQESEPSWVTCDGAAGSGWTEVRVDVQFSAPLSYDQIVAGMNRRLADRGWQQTSAAGGTWTRAVAGGGQAVAALGAGGQAGAWWLYVTAPAQGAQFSENC